MKKFIFIIIFIFSSIVLLLNGDELNGFIQSVGFQATITVSSKYLTFSANKEGIGTIMSPDIKTES
jgi:hypothetical protein